MKHKILIGVALLFSLSVSAKADADKIDIQKGYFAAAKNELEAMLDGSQPLNYERAIFLIENAYNGNTLNYAVFQSVLDYHTQNIRLLMSVNKRKPNQSNNATIFQVAQQSASQREIAFNKLEANWAIFSYMKDTVIPVAQNGHIYASQTKPYSYSFKDPLGTINWNNTQVIHLLDSGTGNCFALSSLYKIFSERLHADAVLSTAPSHIFIRHNNENDIPFNIELSNGSFPGSGTMETLTYTTSDATKNNIALRDLDMKQSIALCLVYLAKGYEQKFGNSQDAFLFQCAETALRHDSLSLNAMLLKMELMQRTIIAKNKTIKELQSDKEFKIFQDLVSKLYVLGYREMPLEMKNILIKTWAKDTSVILIMTNHNAPKTNSAGMTHTRYASLSWGIFDEEIRYKPIERYGLIYLDTKTRRITQFAKEQFLYNDYNFDPVVFAMNVDPLAHKFPWQSPYCAMDNNPIWKNDPTGAAAWVPEVQDGQLAIRKEDGDNVKTLAAFLSVDQKKAAQIYSGMDSKGNIKLPNDVPGVSPINAAIKDYTDNPSDYSKTRFMSNTNYNCWESATSISQGRTPDFKKEMGRLEFRDAILSGYTDVTKNPSQYKFGQTVIRFAENEYSIWHGSVNMTTHGAVFLGKSKDGTEYTWSKNGLYTKPEISSLKDLQKEYGKVEGYGKEKGGGYYNPNPSIQTN